jgi:hypothetical protein
MIYFSSIHMRFRKGHSNRQLTLVRVLKKAVVTVSL